MKEKTLIPGLALLVFAFDAGANHRAMIIDDLEAQLVSQKNIKGPLGVQRIHRFGDGHFEAWFVDQNGQQQHILSKNNGIQVIDTQWGEPIDSGTFNGMFRARASLQKQLSGNWVFDAAYDESVQGYKITRKSLVR